MKAGLREMLSYDIANGNLTQNPREETSCDRIGALARADKLGALLWRITGNMDAKAYIEAREIMVRQLNAPVALCNKALEEWLVTLCGTCTGRGFRTNDAGVQETCGECKGSGRGRHSDGERMRALKIGRTEYDKLVTTFTEAHALLSSADARVHGQVARQLGRRAPRAHLGKK